MAAACGAGFLAGMTAAMGLGGGTVLILYLTLWEGLPQLKAQGINLLFFLPTAIPAVCLYAARREIAFKTVFLMVTGGLLGAVVGLKATAVLGLSLLRKGFGVLILILGAKELLSSGKKQDLQAGK